MAEVHLPAAGWTQRADLAALVAALDPAGTGLVRYVGGAVRDTLMGLPVKDIDMATPLEPAPQGVATTTLGARGWTPGKHGA